MGSEMCIRDRIKQSFDDQHASSLTDNLQDIHFRMILEDGYASFIRNPHTKDPGKTSSNAVPLYRDDELVGAMTLVFFSTSLRVAEAFEKYKDLIFETQNNINRDLVEMKLFNPEDLKLASINNKDINAS